MDRRAPDELEPVGYRRENAVHQNMTLGIANTTECLGNRLGLPWQVDDHGVTPDHTDLTRQDGRGHVVKTDLPHLLAETGHFPVGHRQRRFGRHIPRGRAGATCGEDQVAVLRVHQFDQGLADQILLVGDKALHGGPGGGQGCCKPFLQARQPQILVNALAGAITDGNESDTCCHGDIIAPMKPDPQTGATPLFYTPEHLRDLAFKLLQMARELGASDASAEVSESSGLSVSVRLQSVETIERTRDRAAGITVYSGTRRGHATTSDFSDQALRDAVVKALDIARYTAEDPFAGLPEEHLIAHDPPHVALYFPWQVETQEAVRLAMEAERSAMAVSPMIRNSEGSSVAAHHGQFFSANTRGFAAGYPYSRHWISASAIAQAGASMQRDDWYSSDRNPAMLAAPEAIGSYAGQRALARLNARRLPTGRVPVLFEAPLAGGLLGAFVQAVSGSALYRKSSFLLDCMGERVFPDHIRIHEDPLVPGAMGSAPFDDEGVRVGARDVVSEGVVQGYFLSCYSARKLGMMSTGNAGGAHNLRLESRLTQSGDDLTAMLRKMGRGLLLTEVMGQGVNYVTGDYSRGAFGYWVENGEIAYPVEEITIAANMRDMFKGMVAVGADTICRGTKTTGSVLIDEMTLAGD